MYPIVLAAHNAIRWLVIAAGAWAVLVTWRGWLRRASWTARETRATRLFVGALDLQLVVGVVLYAVLSPLTRSAFRDMGAAMRDAPVRYFVVEHLVIMLLAIAAAHVGAARVQRAASDAARYQHSALWFGVALAAVVGFVPWARPLLPLL
jgi:hypothetical protein